MQLGIYKNKTLVVNRSDILTKTIIVSIKFFFYRKGEDSFVNNLKYFHFSHQTF